MNQSLNTDSKNSKEPQQKYRLGTVSIKILGGLNRFYRRLTSPSASIMAQNIQLFGPRGGFLTHQWIITCNKYITDKSYDEAKMRTRQKCVATDTWRSLGCRTRRYFCCGSLLLLVLAVRIYTLVQLYYASDIFCKF